MAPNPQDDRPMPDREWLRNTAAAVAGALSVVVVGVLAFGDVRSNAKRSLEELVDIRTHSASLEARLRSAETALATQKSELDGFRASLREVRDDVKELLRRIPPK